MKVRQRLVWCWVVPAVILSCVGSEARAASGAAEGVRQYVQKFYDWYVPRALRNNPTPAWNIALSEKKPLFSPKLYSALAEDSEAQAEAAGEIVRLDFDPFLNSQDPGRRYVVGTVTKRDGVYYAPVSVAQSSPKGTPDVVVEVREQGNAWVFVNFHYPKGRDLLTILGKLSDARKQ